MKGTRERQMPTKILAGLMLAAFCGAALAQAPRDPNLAHPHEIVTVKRDGYAISALATHVAGRAGFRHGVALFPGHPGVMRIHDGEDGRPAFEMKGNFLIRTRRFWVDDETVVLAIDAPSDQWNTFS